MNSAGVAVGKRNLLPCRHFPAADCAIIADGQDALAIGQRQDFGGEREMLAERRQFVAGSPIEPPDRSIVAADVNDLSIRGECGIGPEVRVRGGWPRHGAQLLTALDIPNPDSSAVEGGEHLPFRAETGSLRINRQLDNRLPGRGINNDGLPRALLLAASITGVTGNRRARRASLPRGRMIFLNRKAFG